MSDQVTLRQVASMLGQVADMNVAFGKPALEGDVQPHQLRPQIQCIEEELDELDAAIEEHSLKDMRDAICDVLVFAFGVAHLGKFPVLAFVAPCSNLVGGEHAYAKMLRNTYDRLIGATTNAVIQYETTTLIERALELSVVLGLDIESDMDAVYVSNMSKFCTNPEEMDATIGRYAQKGVKVVPKGAYPRAYVVSAEHQTDSDGKIYPEGKFLKGVGFFEPQFQENKGARYASKEAYHAFLRVLRSIIDSVRGWNGRSN